jgi:mRNA degradation ribonuclease J1/J2
LKKRANRVLGIFITHGHEDHIGAIQHVIADISAPIYATPLTRGLIEGKLLRNNSQHKAQIKTIKLARRQRQVPSHRIFPCQPLHPRCRRAWHHHPCGAGHPHERLQI